MKRNLLRPGLAGLLLLSFFAEARALDRVTYHDRAAKNPKAEADGTIQEESPAGVKLKLANNTVKAIPAEDIVEIDYQHPASKMTRQDFRVPFVTETKAERATKAEDRKKLAAEAVAQYRQLAPKLDEAKFAQRYVLFRAAQLQARLADDDPSQQPAAVDALKEFLAKHKDGWELSDAVALLGQLYERRQDLAAARQLYEEQAARADLPPPKRREFSLAAVRWQIRDKKFADAEQKLRELARGLPPEDPLAPRLEVYRAECLVGTGKPADAEKSLRAVVAGPAEDGVKAQAYNALGDLYRATERAEDAFWSYLWVDVLYDQDPAELARALYHLAKLFQDVKKDPERARQCRERLRTDKQFAGLEYQKLVEADK